MKDDAAGVETQAEEIKARYAKIVRGVSFACDSMDAASAGALSPLARERSGAA